MTQTLPVNSRLKCNHGTRLWVNEIPTFKNKEQDKPERQSLILCPTVVAVWLVLMLGVSEGQHWVGAAGQAGTPPGWFTQPPSAPQPHGALRWHHGLTVGIQVLGRADREAAVRQTHLGAEGQAAARRRRLADSQLTKTEMLSWKNNHKDFRRIANMLLN